MDQSSTSGFGVRAQIDSFLGKRPGGWAMHPFAIGVVALGAVLVMAWLLLGGSGDTAQYATALVERGDLRVSVSATGNLQPTNKVEVGSELSGIITEVLVDNNDRVSHGQVLARLDTSRLQDTVRESEAALASAQASVAQSQATLTQADIRLKRLEDVYRLSGGAAPSANDLDIARADQARAAASLRVTQAAVGQVRATLSSNRTQLSKATIRSPVAGVVLSRAVEPGQTVAASFNAPVLFTLAEDLSRMQLEVKVDEADVGQVKAGQRATFQVDAYPGRSFDATVTRLDLGSTTTTSSSGSGQVVAYTAVLTAANSDLALRPGMTGTASIIAAEKSDVLLVPNSALRFTPATGAGGTASGVTSVLMPRRLRSSTQAASVNIGRGSYQTLYVLGDEGKIRSISVQVGGSNGSQTEVSGEGLTAGLKVVTGQLAGQGNGTAQ
ncbi:MAG: efflux RND transporter periplasmic adaptor subunit [Alphaproteobacteria bacterium]|nr:efflux RND transporter periplasmic adaptor subunit [Alphaproteobacteria bacterium]